MFCGDKFVAEKLKIDNMKRVLNLFLCLFMGLMSWAQLPELSVEQHLEDYDFAVKW